MDTKFVLQEKINVKNRPAVSTKTITSACPLCKLYGNSVYVICCILTESCTHLTEQ